MTSSDHRRLTYTAAEAAALLGYLDGTSAVDGEGVDVWLGSLPERRVTGAIFTVDVRGRDAEVKLLLGCTREEAQTAAAFQNSRPDGTMGALLVLRV